MSRIASCRRLGSFVRKSKAFTLVELLVVIGIIGALIAILLPVLAGVQARGRDIKCQSNLRQLVQAMLGYAAENRGSMPYGFYMANSNTGDGTYDNPGDWGPREGDWDQPFISWPSLLGHWMAKTRDATNEEDGNFPPVMQCPEAQQNFPHPLSYVMNMIVAISPFDELRMGPPPNAQLKPPKVTQMLRDTALVWDTPVQPNWAHNLGFLLGADIDGQRFWRGASFPEFRYYNDRDPYAAFPGATYANNTPVRLNVGNINYRNIDPPARTHYPWQGTLRFRHQKESACNVGFSDGHVSAFTAVMKPDKTLTRHTAIRRQFMVKYPTGVVPTLDNP